MFDISIEMANRDKIQRNQMLLGKTVFLRGREIVMDLILFDMTDFDIILGMDFLSHYEVGINYKKKKVWF